MPSRNIAIIEGHAGRDAELKNLPNTLVANFTVATSEWAGKDKPPKTEWHEMTAFGALADYAGAHVKKGCIVRAHGRISTRSWMVGAETKYRTSIIVDCLTVEPKREQGGQPFTRNDPPRHAGPEEYGDTDEIPF